MKLARVLGIVILVLVVLAILGYAVGMALPVAHVASRRATIPAPPDSVWRAILDVEAYPRWRSDVTRVEIDTMRGGRLAWRETSGGDILPLEVVDLQPPSRLEVRIRGEDLPFGGSWTWRLDPSGPAATRVTITERGEIYAPPFRTMARFAFGYHSTIDRYLRALGRRFGADVEPVDADTAR